MKVQMGVCGFSYKVVNSSHSLVTLMVISKKLMLVGLVSWVNFIVGWIMFKYSINSLREFSPWVHIMNMSSMNLSQINGFKGQFARALVANLSMKRFA